MTGSTAIEDMASGSVNDAQGVAVAFALMALCALFFAITRANAVRRTFATSHHMAEANVELLRVVARVQRARTAVFATACALAAIAFTQLSIASEIKTVWSLTATLLAGIALVSLWQLQRLLDLQRDGDVKVTIHGHFLFAARGTRLAGWVAAPPSIIARATALPVARLT